MNKTTIATHNGSFHADDVFAVATLLLVYPVAEVIRTRDPEKINAATIAVDVGTEYDPPRLRFDHHQAGGAGIRANTIPYASFGLIWKEHGLALSGGDRDVAQIIEQKLVMPVDALDNGVEVSHSVFDGIRTYSVSDFFYSFIEETHPSEEYLDEAFRKVVMLAQGVIVREIGHARNELKDENDVKRLVETTLDPRLIIMDRPMSWHRVLIPLPEVLYVVYPRYGERWGLEVVPKHFVGFERKKPLPESWAGKSDHELAAITGVPDAMFCHNKRFLAVAGTKEGALKLAEIALNS
jgi:uncharacterized UPF0160 family protein